MSLHLHPLNGTDRASLVLEARHLLDEVDDRWRCVVVLDACAVGEIVPARQRVVAVMARAQEVIAERLTPDGITRVVRVGDVPAVDAGARALPDDTWAFPPADLDGTAAALADELEAPVVLALRTPTPRAVAMRGTQGRWAGLLAATDGAGLVLEGADDSPAAPDVPAPDKALGGRAESVRAAFGVLPGTPEAVDVGIPPVDEDDMEARVGRAARLAVRPLPQAPSWHPLARLVRIRVDLSPVVASTLQIGVRLEAPDDYTLGIATGRLLTALAVEGLTGVPVEHETGATGVTTVVGILTERRPST